MTEDIRKTAPDAAATAAGGEKESISHHPDTPNVPPAAAPVEVEGLALKARIEESVSYLQHWRPNGPWVLTAIIPDGTTKTDTFSPGNETALREWLARWAGKRNIYFTVNDTYGPLTSKASKADIAFARALHVDIDPRPGEDLAAERERAERLLREYDPPPSIIIDSGGGFQGFWLLDEPVKLDGDPRDETRHLPVELRNLAIEVALQADACHDVSRIMRLPGTINVPGKKKLAKGRKPALARVVDEDWSRRYRLDAFPLAPPLASSTAPLPAGGAARRIEAAADVDVDALPVSSQVRALIVNGTDPDEPDKWADRSRLVMHVLCEMIRADVPDAIMKAVVLHPDLGVSAHVLDKNNPDTYADRQIRRALDHQPRPGPILHGGAMDWARAFRDGRRPRLLHHLEEFLDWDGAAYISVADGTVRAEAWSFLEACRLADKENNMRPFNPTPATVSAALDALKAVTHLPPSREEPPRWLDGRADPDPMELLPTRSGLLHLPTGKLLLPDPELFTRNALSFAHDPAAPEPRRWLSFLKEVWPGEDEADCILALQEFMGYLLTPDTRLQKALLIPGPKRSGKGTIGRIMGKLVGEANTVAPSLNSLGRGSDFALEPLLAKQLAIVSDMRLSSRTDEAAVAENLLRITGEDRVSVNRKHRQAVEVTLRARFVVMTNEVPKFADRSGALVSRFIVLPMRQTFFGREDTGLTAALEAELPGILNWAVEGWRRVRANGRITQPAGGDEVALQMTDLASPIPAFVSECCETGGGLTVAKERLFEAFRAWHRERIGNDYVGSANVFARDLYSAMDGQVREVRTREGGGRTRAFGGLDLRPGFAVRRRDDDLPWT